MSASWTAKAMWMRDHRATAATWDAADNLTSLTLAPALPEATDDTETQPSISPAEQERLAREQRRALVARSSGGPVLKLDAIG